MVGLLPFPISASWQDLSVWPDFVWCRQCGALSFCSAEISGCVEKSSSGCGTFLVIGLTLIFCIDATITMFSWTSLNKNLKELHEKVFALTNEKMEDVSDYLVDKLPFEIREEKNGLQVRFDNVNVRLKKAELRFIHAFPKMEFSAYGKLSNKLRMREHTMNVFDRNIRRK